MAIKKNYVNTLLAQEQASAARQRQIADKQELQRQQERLTHAQDTALAAAGQAIIAATPEVVEHAITDLRQTQDAGFRFSYEPEKSALENYHEHRYIMMSVNKWLEERFPAQFVTVRRAFHAQHEKIATALSALEHSP